MYEAIPKGRTLLSSGLNNCYFNILQLFYIHYTEFYKSIPVTRIQQLEFISCDNRFWANDKYNVNNTNNNDNDNNTSQVGPVVSRKVG